MQCNAMNTLTTFPLTPDRFVNKIIHNLREIHSVDWAALAASNRTDMILSLGWTTKSSEFFIDILLVEISFNFSIFFFSLDSLREKDIAAKLKTKR